MKAVLEIDIAFLVSFLTEFLAFASGSKSLF